MSRTSLAGVVVALLAGLVSGCGPSLKATDGTRVSLRVYDSVNLKSVDRDPTVPYPGLPRQLSTMIAAKLYLNKMWALPAGTYSAYGPATSEPTGRTVDLQVLILAARYPSKGSRILLGAPNTMRCRMEVLDHASSTFLGAAEVCAVKGPSTHGVLSGAMGVAVNAMTDMPEMNELLLNDQMAGAIIEVLERAKRE
jgi:hypothetical protein